MIFVVFYRFLLLEDFDSAASNQRTGTTETEERDTLLLYICSTREHALPETRTPLANTAGLVTAELLRRYARVRDRERLG